jgi:hypothetical protein
VLEAPLAVTGNSTSPVRWGDRLPLPRELRAAGDSELIEVNATALKSTLAVTGNTTLSGTLGVIRPLSGGTTGAAKATLESLEVTNATCPRAPSPSQVTTLSGTLGVTGLLPHGALTGAGAKATLESRN